MITSKYKHIIWDWNGTLLDDAWLCVDVMNSLLSKQNLPLLTLDSYRDIFSFPIRTYYDNLGFDYSIESFETVATNFIISYEKRKFECSLRDDALMVLEFFKVKGKKQYILSASKIDSLREITKFYKLEKYFQSLNGLDDHYAFGKTEIGRHLLINEGLNPDETLLIGDTDHDCEVAEELGITSILMKHGHNSDKRLSGCGKPVYNVLREIII